MLEKCVLSAHRLCLWGHLSDTEDSGPGCPQFDKSYVIRLQQTQLIQLNRIVNISVREMRMRQIWKLYLISPQKEGVGGIAGLAMSRTAGGRKKEVPLVHKLTEDNAYKAGVCLAQWFLMLVFH